MSMSCLISQSNTNTGSSNIQYGVSLMSMTTIMDSKRPKFGKTLMVYNTVS